LKNQKSNLLISSLFIRFVHDFSKFRHLKLPKPVFFEDYLFILDAFIGEHSSS